MGGGLTGTSAALALAKKGARVVVCEAETIGHAASGRNGGMCNNGFAQDSIGLLSTANGSGRFPARTVKSIADRMLIDFRYL